MDAPPPRCVHTARRPESLPSPAGKILEANVQKLLKPLLLLGAVAALSGCRYDILSPSGWVAEQQRDLLVISTLLMLIIIVPVIFMALWFPLRYRADREDTRDYAPTWAHSNKLEVVIWGVPIAIVAALGTFTWIYTHRLDPYRPLDVAGEPLVVEAVSLDWKWLFIYPELGVASVNELAIPANRPINLRLTSSTMMNTFSVPALAGMVYSMPGMQTKLHLIADHTGVFDGRSAHFSGPGFSEMTFKTRAMGEEDFGTWVTQVRAQDTALTSATYPALEAPSIANPVSYYASVEPGLFDKIRGMCVTPGKVCADHMMMQDEQGGGGLDGIKNKPQYEYDSERAIDGFGTPLNKPQTETPAEPPKGGMLQLSSLLLGKELTHGN
jgi:cytochrome o ubiquinol oxidase subunit II